MSKLARLTMRVMRRFVRMGVFFASTRKVVNFIYLRLPPTQRAKFHQEFSKIFRDGRVPRRDGIWIVRFAGKTIVMPLRADRFWLDWDSAVSITGHDIDVKETYRALLESPSSPEWFVDVGANYGTHSLLFLMHNVRTLTFEPNVACHDCFLELCRMNHVEPALEPVALGERPGVLELAYPTRDTWLGSVDKCVIEELAGSHELIRRDVEVRMLDAYSGRFGSGPGLVKIDAEGSELSVLRGGEDTLRTLRPRVIFESNKVSERSGLFEFFLRQDYRIFGLPFSSTRAGLPFLAEAFEESAATNFIAVPSEMSRVQALGAAGGR